MTRSVEDLEAKLLTEQSEERTVKTEVVHKLVPKNYKRAIACGVNYYNTTSFHLNWKKVTCKRCLKTTRRKK